MIGFWSLLLSLDEIALVHVKRCLKKKKKKIKKNEKNTKKAKKKLTKNKGHSKSNVKKKQETTNSPNT